jgi:DNA helicase-2/ATP-dependent DNA helicase PcrA
VVITDYKTGKPQSQEDADKSLQLSVYALAAQEKWGYQVDHLVLYNLAENTSVAASRNAVQLEAARLKVEEVAGKVAEGKFDPKTGYHCRLCAYRSLCPATERRFDTTSAAKKNKRDKN